MPIYSRNPLMLAGEDIKPESTSGEVFGALFGEATQSGLLGVLSREEELNIAEREVRSAGSLREGIPSMQLTKPKSPVLTPEQARQRLRDSGLDQNLSVPEQGIRQETLDILMERKREELRRQMILSQSSGGAAVFAGLTGSLVGSLVDPTNIALAFVPVVGQSRYAAWLAKAGGVAGRTGVRAGVGAAEGLVGLAPVEALNYYANQRQQADYDAYDSMVAIAGGAFFGSALHAGAGLLGDALRPGRWATPPPAAPRADPGAAGAPGRVATPIPVPDAAARERMMVMERLAEGRPVTQRQVEAVMFRGEGAGSASDGRFYTTDRAYAAKYGTAIIREALGLEGKVIDLSPAIHPTLADTFDDEILIGIIESAVGIDAASEIVSRIGLGGDGTNTPFRAVMNNELLDTASTLGVSGFRFKQGTGETFAVADMAALRRAEIGADARFVDSLTPEVRAQLEADPFMPIRPFVASLTPETQAAALRMAISQAVSGRPIDVAPAVLSDGRYFDPESAFAAATRNATEVDGANPSMAEWAATVKPLPDDVESAAKVVDDTEEDVLARFQAAGREMSESERAALDALASEAKAQGEAAKVAAMCMMRTGG